MRTATVVGLLVLLVLAVSAAGAEQPEECVLYGSYEDIPLVGWWPADASGMIGVGGVEFFVIPGNGGGLTLPVRAEIVDSRITEILSEGISGPVRVGDVRGQPTIYVGLYRLITVYDIDAVNAGAISAQVLAEKWAQSVAAALPQVLPSPYAAAQPVSRVSRLHFQPSGGGFSVHPVRRMSTRLHFQPSGGGFSLHPVRRMSTRLPFQPSGGGFSLHPVRRVSRGVEK